MARDPAGNATEEKLTLTLSTLPPDPATVAPPIDRTVATALSKATEFLYTGPDPIQTGVEAGTIEPRRVAVIRGRVLTRDDAPLGGVTVTVLDHPELGQTLSRADGRFDLAVNGGGVLTVNYEKEGYLPAQRKIDAPWRDYVVAEDVALVPLDPEVTTITAGADAPQVAQGSVSTDADGSRQATMLFLPDTTATMVLPDGTTQPLSTLNVRATEYTVGENGPMAMPAELPPTSGYTYAVELGADEAIAAGAKEVVFNRPVIQYVENFLNFPIGGIVPAGHYDREKAAWIPSDNGKVINVIGASGGLAEIDADGDGSADTAEQLTALGITDTERAQLASLYSADTSLWRVPVKHFSPWDYNWPYGPPEDAREPEQPDPQRDDQEDDPCLQAGSIIECQNQVLRETIPIVGTPFSLNYRSDRVPGRSAANTISISLSGETVPSSLRRIELRIEVAGREFAETFPAEPKQQHLFTWDGRDAYGRTVSGTQTARVRIGYVYQAVYQEPASFERSFGAVSGVPITGSRAREEITLWQTSHTRVGAWDARGQGLGGWAITPHHSYDPMGQVLHLGTGVDRSQANLNAIITSIPGLAVGFAVDAAAGPDGRVYFVTGDRVRSVSPDGTVDRVAGFGFGGNGGPAVDARLDGPFGIAIAPDGSIYISENHAHRIRKISPAGIISTVAGIGQAGFSGDGGPATAARFRFPKGLAVGPDGSLYIADSNNNRIRRVSPDGIITTVAGSGVSGFAGDGGPATQARLKVPQQVAAGADGSIYVADALNRRVRRISPDGIITTVAGTGQAGSRGDGGPATAANLSPSEVGLGPDGSLFIADCANDRIRRVSPAGIITTVAGSGVSGFAGDGGPAANASLNCPMSLAVGADGDVTILDSNNGRIRRVSSSFPQFALGDVLIASEDGSQLYLFTPEGRHVRTISARTGATIHAFGYDPAGLLQTITDGDGNATRIEREPSGNPTAIVSSDGLRTTLSLDADGYLSSITNPAGESFAMEYTADGLLTAFTNPRQTTSVFTYDALGRLTKDADAAAGFLSLSRTELPGGYEVNERSALDRARTYRVEKLPTGDRQWLNIGTDGTQTQTFFKTDGTTATTTADGTTTTIVEGPDPRFGMQAPVQERNTIRTPNGLTREVTTARHVSLDDPSDLLSLRTQTDTVTRNGNTTTTVFDAAGRQRTVTSAVGRETRTVVDDQGRPTELTVSGLNSIAYGYDPRGRLTSITQGERTVAFSYNPEGFLESVTDPLARVQTFTYDGAGRVRTQTLPDGRIVEFTYDANGNVTGITPPGRPEHTFDYTPVDLEEQYTPPVLSDVPEPFTRFAYNRPRAHDHARLFRQHRAAHFDRHR